MPDEKKPKAAPPPDATGAPIEATPAPPAAVSVREYAAAKGLASWQLAALLPHVRAAAIELKLEPLADEVHRVLPVEELDAALNRALHGR